MSDPASQAPPMDAATLIAVWNQLETAIFQVQIYFAALCAIVFYEWVVNLRREYKLVWKAEWTLPKAAYLLIRYTGVVHAIVDLYAYYGLWEAESCKRFVAFIPAFPIFGVLLSHFIMLIQCHAVWGRAPFVLIVLAPIMLAEGVIMAVSTFTQIGPLPVMTELGPCLPRALSAFPIVYFALPMFFDLTVTTLTAVKTLKLRQEDQGIGMGSSLLNTMIQQSFQYFIFITAANFTNIVYYAVDANDPMSSINGPLAIIATELFACRLTLSLREVKARNEGKSMIMGRTEKSGSGKHFVKIIMFGDSQGNANELSTINQSRQYSLPQV